MPNEIVRRYVHTAHCKIAPGSEEVLMQALLRNAHLSRTTEPGCLGFDVLVDPENPRHIMLYEVFRDLAAFEAHQQTAHHRQYVAEGVPHLLSRERGFLYRLD